MKKKIVRYLFSVLDIFRLKIHESDFDQKNFCWKEESKLRFSNIDKAWKNICINNRKYFDSKVEFEQDLKAFNIELLVHETMYILEFQYGVQASYKDLFEFSINTELSASGIAIEFIKKMNYQIIK